MKYKMKSNGDMFKMTIGSSGFYLQEPQDIIELSFDPDEQLFIANIKFPSNHTMYLLNEGLLGITLCKLNTGYSQRNHMQESTDYDEDGGFFVKKNYHPRWSRCGRTVFPINSLSNIYIPIDDISVYDLKPNQKHTLGGVHENWFTYIKATLISRGQHSLGIDYPYEAYASDRAYKTYCNRIGIRYNESEGVITDRSTLIRKGFLVTPLGGGEFRISFQNLSSFWIGEDIDILMATNDISNMHSHGLYARRYENDDEDYRQDFVSSFKRMHSNGNSILATVTLTSNSDTFDVELPDLEDIYFDSGYIHPRVEHAHSKAVRNNFRRGSFTYTSPICIQIRRHYRDTKMYCLNEEYETVSYDTGLVIDIIDS